MTTKQQKPLHLEFRPLTSDHWSDFETLFRKHGASAGCWCMWWRLTRREFEQQQGEANRQAMKAIVESGEVPGILAYSDGQPVAWCSVAPRERFASLERSRVLKRLDDRPVWSIVCLLVDKAHRGQGIAESLIRGAVDHATSHGARVIEAYPTVPKTDRVPSGSSYMGIPAMFERAGFVECVKPSQSRMIMRYFAD